MSLVEPGMRSYLQATLAEARHADVARTSWYVNGIILAVLALLVCSVLWWRYRGSPSPMERFRKAERHRQYILDRVQHFQAAKQSAHQALITGLPHWDNEFSAPLLLSAMRS